LSRWKSKYDHEIAQIYNNIDEHGLNPECSELLTDTIPMFGLLLCLRVPETAKLGAHTLSGQAIITNKHNIPDM